MLDRPVTDREANFARCLDALRRAKALKVVKDESIDGTAQIFRMVSILGLCAAPSRAAPTQLVGEDGK